LLDYLFKLLNARKPFIIIFLIDSELKYLCSFIKETETVSSLIRLFFNFTINLGSIAATTSLVVSQSSRLDDGIFTSSEEVLDDQMHSPNSGDAVPHQQQNSKSSGSLDGDGDRGSIISWGDEIRPASAQANPVSRMCTGAFSRALVRLSGDVSSRSSAASTSSTDSSELIRRQSSPVFRLSTS
jgi:hypothetical protein